MSVLRNLEEVHFKGFLLGELASAIMGEILASKTRLRALGMEACNDGFAPLLMALNASGSKCELRDLCFAMKYDEPSQMPTCDRSIQAISQFVSLEALTLVLFGAEYALTYYPVPAELFAPLSALTQLRSLSIREEYHDYERLGDFSSILMHLQGLQHLSLPRLPSRPELAVLPETLESLVDTGIRDGRDVHHLCDSLIDIATHIRRHPKLRNIHCHALNLEAGPAGDYAALPQALSALSHVHLTVENVRWVDDLDDLLNFFYHAQSLVKSVVQIEFLAEFGRDSEANFASLAELCPTLTCIKVHTGLPCDAPQWDPACIFGARWLRSLKELRLALTGDILDAGDLGQCSHALLSLAIAMSAKEGPPLTMVIEGRACHEKQSVDADIGLLHQQWASMSKALKCLDCNQGHVHLQIELA
ncbi:hypothetical protein DUNSADRAFT_3432 [Dunaliella salina]|uniref:Encoded protein n=1 Tax=Dunaliella salina TaxID=3046 RepID=A0ABQ7GTY5_DUNSA|nr:hypothetical protein DUNSADRAFT_3432 [Dunaliella salina]|eukprot:KAF5838062.1 hypothetical protein DUNSADRAFT_3432 [Dunaliella salina]